jgi:hypothetical protein
VGIKGLIEVTKFCTAEESMTKSAHGIIPRNLFKVPLKKLPAHGRLDEPTRKALGVSSFKENLEKIAWNNAVSTFCQALLCSAEFRYLD